MQTAILQGKSTTDFNLLLKLAGKLNIKAKILSEEEIEDIGLINAIKVGETGNYIDVNKYLKKLNK
jgi:hypothetical protein